MQARSRIVFLDFLRALAILFVIWDHLVGQWLEQRGRGWWPLAKVEEFATGPLAVIQHAGWLGVCLFFLISGFIISHVASKETRPEFAVKRVLRIYPPMIAAIVVTMLLARLRIGFSIADTSGSVPPLPGVGDALWSSSLVNYIMVPQHVVLGVAWSLFIELCFYALVFVVRPLLNRAGWASWCILAFVALTSFTVREYGPNWFLLGVSVSYVPILVAGQALWLRWSGRVGTAHFLVVSAASWALWVHGLHSLQPSFLTPDNSYGASLVIAYSLFCVALLCNRRIKGNRVVSYVATRSYSIYLLHGPVGLLVLDVTYGHWPFTLALVTSVLAVATAAELSYRYLELPTQSLARLIVRLRRRRTAGTTYSAARRSPEKNAEASTSEKGVPIS